MPALTTVPAQAAPASHTPSRRLADPALVELALSEREAAVDRSRALRLMGFDPDQRLRVLAVATGTNAADCRQTVGRLAGGTLRGRHRCTVLADVAAVLFQSAKNPGCSPAGDLSAVLRADRDQPGGDRELLDVVVGVGGAVTALDAHESWRQATLALRFTAHGRHQSRVVEFDGLGALAIVAEVPEARLRQNPDLVALEALTASDIEALEVFCLSGSLRQAAAALHLHHSSVAARLDNIEAALGWRLDDPLGRFRAMLALLARTSSSGRSTADRASPRP
ncbi:helix-turn-helix domain-containing protein [Frankia sp. AgB1.9]|uniref:helix-turn-helix domain-containing protein n=1 Tax=unclassified Frankia TaxID=2632575 RepID=UPI00193309E2|nr:MULTISPECIES: PucR family transcriptional regulator [unclassified Frankia]MBL7489419.1 helix-turn-helix domain-containing protein [Frankia sp. AgW1.1]MBL7550646.1 helix-turn-helix domain-containing protein [Frankia sp. AgB1.9]MBL7620979.1 helix-turn-helix domain-containing protein [Frankia sp. AgB1.8]